MATEDNFLLSNENLRASPELWPERVPGSDNYMKSAAKNAKENAQGLTQDDIRQIYRKSKSSSLKFLLDILNFNSRTWKSTEK